MSNDGYTPANPADPAAIATLAALRGITVPPVKFSNASETVSTEGYVLRADHLDARWGFGDGDAPNIVQSMAQEWFNDDDVYVEQSVWHPILFHLVTTRLLPAIDATDAPVRLMSTHHNPIRFTDPTYKAPAGSVTVPWMDLLALVVVAMPDQRILSDEERSMGEFGSLWL